MKPTYRKVPTRFGPKTRFELELVRPAPPRAVREAELERLKNRLLRERLTTTTDPDTKASLRRAANEAAALAWTTDVPFLVFPALFEEKVGTAVFQAARQEHIWERSRELLAA